MHVSVNNLPALAHCRAVSTGCVINPVTIFFSAAVFCCLRGTRDSRSAAQRAQVRARGVAHTTMHLRHKGWPSQGMLRTNGFCTADQDKMGFQHRF